MKSDWSNANRFFIVREIIDFVVGDNCFKQQCPCLGKSATASSRFGTFLRVRAHLSGPSNAYRG